MQACGDKIAERVWFGWEVVANAVVVFLLKGLDDGVLCDGVGKATAVAVSTRALFSRRFGFAESHEVVVDAQPEPAEVN